MLARATHGCVKRVLDVLLLTRKYPDNMICLLCLCLCAACPSHGPHVAPLDIVFYSWQKGANFPKSWHHMLFIVQRDSWNCKESIGARIMTVRIDGKTGTPTYYRPLLMGWLQNPRNLEEQEYWGLPVGLVQMPDASLLVSDDTYGATFRITYTGSN